MKRLILLCMMMLSLPAMSASLEEAQALFAKRGENPNFALQAADMYRSLATQTRDQEVQAEMKLFEAQAIYFSAYKMPASPKNPKLAAFERGYEAANLAVTYFARTGNKTSEAKSLYWYGSNLGKWGETNGVLASLRKWPELKEKTLRIRQLDPTVYDYGANRILGKAYLSVPFESNEEGLAFLQESFDQTLVTIPSEDMTISRNPVNNSYLLDAYMNRNRVAQFCPLFENFDDYLFAGEELWSEISPDLIPETYIEQDKFEKDNELQDFYASNC